MLSIAEKRFLFPLWRIIVFQRGSSMAAMAASCTERVNSGPMLSGRYLCPFLPNQWYPKADLLLDSDSFGSGTFLPELPEPEHCNAQSTALWELHLLKVGQTSYIQSRPLRSPRTGVELHMIKIGMDIGSCQ